MEDQTTLKMNSSSLTLAFDYIIWKSKGVIHSLGTTSVPNLVTTCIKQRSFKSYADTICSKISSLTLTFDNVTRKSIGNISSLRASIVSSLTTLKQRGQEILRGQPLFKKTQLFDLWTCMDFIIGFRSISEFPALYGIQKTIDLRST